MMNNKKLLLVKTSGNDQPGITSELMKCLSQSKVLMKDIGQSIIHGQLSLSFLIEIDPDNKDSVLKDLLFTANTLNLSLDFEFIEDNKDFMLTGDKYILSCVALDGITPHFLSDITSVLASNKVNITAIDHIKESNFKALDISTQSNNQTEWTDIKSQLMTLSNKHHTDLALLKDDVWRRNKRLIIFDMDSTLIQSEVIVEMAKVHGVGDKVHEITEQAMNGKFDFDESLRERVKLLEGLEESKLQDILHKIQLTNGVEDFINTVKKLGYKVGIISGGFSYFANYFKDSLGLDYAFSNELEIKAGKLTGKVSGSIVNADKKAILLDLIAQQEGIKLEQVVAIGDGANDLPMLAKAGLGIAFHAKDIVKKNAKQHMSHGPMTSILYFLGIPGTKEY